MTPPDRHRTRYQHLTDTLSERMDDGVYQAGQRLPGVRRLAREFSVSVSTVLRAMEQLESFGRVEARPRSGYYVRASRKRSLPAPQADITPSPQAIDGQDRVLQLLRGGQSEGMLSLAAAMPDAQQLPLRLVNKALVSAARRRGPDDALYDFPPGHAPLRQAIARRMHLNGCPVDPADIVITGGCQQALGLALQSVCAPGDLVAVESPTYYGLLQVLEAHRLKALEIPSHPETGLSLEALRMALDNWPIRACVLVPSYSNPTGSCMPESHRQRLVSMAGSHNFTIVEDDVYGDLAHDGSRALPVRAFDQADRVVYCNSFSKTLAPDLRVGWVSSPRLSERLCQLQFAGQLAAPGLAQRALTELLQGGGIDRHLRRVRASYMTNISRAVHLVDQYFPAGTEVTNPAGGYVIWVRVPGLDSEAFQRHAANAGVLIAPGTLFSTGRRYADCCRINCSRPWGTDMDTAIRLLGHLAREPHHQKNEELS
ncbi:DNA-binding transcriptional MocR family regulator [Natronocella acetinitrilica]|uniref:DNA-binding transcriptional MocR family regulator n=1 Tax=Natronocella acetinitrilica TaxID=414046 RepID=A0AAE3KAR0_9GAMM|nr:PLP-dependent aminotransferase family protein [Natronocella acetinitrilica]MCP1674675.1 DNA-binding transcriptional MocR family regulator [Natronocella acetinitrilica]